MRSATDRFYRNLSSVTLAICCVLSAGCEEAAEYPNRPLLLVCPWAVGGGTDRVSRQVAELLKQKLGQPVNVINATGGAGVTGHDRGARAKPDGYTLLMMTVEINMLHWRGLTDLTYRDYRPLMLINRDAAALFVRHDAPWDSLAALTEDVRKEPRRFKGSGTATGGIWHLAMVGWLNAAGMAGGEVVWISDMGAGPSLKELASGGLDLVVCSLPEAQSLLDANQVRCLGVMADARVAQYADVPTFREQGVDWTMGGWRGLGLPRGVPEEIFQKLLEVVTDIVTEEPGGTGLTFKEFMATQGFDAAVERPAEFLASLERADRDLGRLIKEQLPEAGSARFGPFFFPTIVGVALGCALLALLAQELMARRQRAPAGGSAVPGDGRTAGLEWSRDGLIYAIESLLMVAALIILFEPAGFILSAGAFLFYLLLRFRVHPLLSLALTLVTVPGIYELFARQFGVPLPHGLFGW